jgi:translation initiation factor 2 beta subunit (eIF-2beta)/eIF-5
MAIINIAGVTPIVDPFYRYKMRKLDVVQQRNNVAVRNIPDVAADLAVEPEILIKFFKRDFSSSFTYKEGILVGSKTLTYNDFADSLTTFIENFVLCPVCRLPETKFVRDGANLCLKCNCCPNTTKITGKSKKVMDTADDILVIIKKVKFVECGTCRSGGSCGK